MSFGVFMKVKIFILLLIVAPFFNFAQHVKIHNSSLSIKNAWMRTSAQGSNSALFFEIVNNSEKPDTLLSAESNMAEVVEVHETFKRENDMVGMRKVSSVVIPPKSIVKFKPRDLHVMLIKLKRDLKLNEEGETTLIFKKAGKIKVEAVVRDMQMISN